MVPCTYRVLDGGVATELSRLGLDLSDDLWSARVLIDEPEAIERVHREYFLAGADIAITASYQASYEGFAGQRGEGDRDGPRRINREWLPTSRCAPAHHAHEAAAPGWRSASAPRTRDSA